MDTRVLYIVAIAIAAVSGGYYYYSGKAKNWMLMISQYDLFSKWYQLTQTMKVICTFVQRSIDLNKICRKTSKLKTYASMYKMVSDATFSSKVANGYDDNEKVILSGDVVATRLLIKVKLFFELMS
jgi:lipopolysaccharide export system protein LptC